MKKLILVFLLLILPAWAFAQNVSIDGVERTSVDILEFKGMAAPSTSNTNRARIYLDSTSGILMCSEDGGAYAACVGGSGNFLADGTVPMTAALTLFSDAAPTTDAAGEAAFDTNAWAAGRGAVQVYDGTANTFLVGILSSDTCEDGQIPKWGTGGTWTCENDNNTAGITAADTQVIFSDGADNPVGDAGMTYNKTTNALTVGSVITAAVTAPSTDYYDSDATDGDVSAQRVVNCSEPGTTIEDCDVTDSSQVSGAMTAFMTRDASGPTTTIANLVATSPTFATSINGSYLTASEMLITDGSKNIVSAAVATYPSLTELSYVKGLTSAVQTQLDGRHYSRAFDPAGWYDQETNYRVIPLFRVAGDSPSGITITSWYVNYVGGDPTTELDADIMCDTTPDFNPAANATVMDVIDTTAGASSATSGFDSANCANGSQVYIRLGADPTDANVIVAFDMTFKNQ